MEAKNVLGGPLEACSFDPITGYYRDGCCHSDASDFGSHTLCVRVTEAFLAFSRAAGNDLSTPVPEYRFRGLRPGDRWCVCALRWLDACNAGHAPPVVLEASHERALERVPLAQLQAHAWRSRDLRL